MLQNSVKAVCLLLLACLLAGPPVKAQEELLNVLLQPGEKEAPALIEATFKSTRLINGHTIETRRRGVLDVIISHRFGRINSGPYELFGLDDANIRLGLDYGISDRFNLGIGRSSFEKVYDGFAKYKLIGQGTAPLSVVAFASLALKSMRSPLDLSLTNRLSYTWQLLLAHKVSERLSLQLMPTLVHRNLSLTEADLNDVWALGAGGRYKLSKRIALNAEYYYLFQHPLPEPNHNSLSVGLDIETGGHVFQLHLTNSRAMQEQGFITQTSGNIFKGDIHFGFNISRVFQF